MACQKDLHSIYIDDEMPETFVPEYESLLKSDSESSADYERMKKIHDLLNFDAESESSKISDEFMEESFRRLQSKMRFSQTVEMAAPKKNAFSFMKFPVSFAAAAAVFAVIFVPLSSRNSADENVAINAISHIDLQPVADADVKIDGNIDSYKLPEVFSAVAKAESAAGKTVSASVSTAVSSKNSEHVVKSMGNISEEPKVALSENPASETHDAVQQKTIQASAVVSSRTRNFGPQMTSVDVFRPNFSSNSSMQMRVPEFGEIPVQQE